MGRRADRTVLKSFMWNLFGFSFAILLLASSGEGTDWPQFQRDETHSGLCTDEVLLIPQIKWSADLYSVSATPIISSGLVYALTDNGSLSAMDKKTGEMRWRSQINGWTLQTSTPTCNGDKIFAATDSGVLAAFNASNGRKLWSRSLTNKRFEGPLTCSEGLIYLGEGSAYGKSQKRYFCFDEDGDEIWNITRNTTGYQWCGACVAGDYLIFGENDGVLLSVDRRIGKVADKLNLNNRSRLSFAKADSGRIRASASFHDDYVYTTSESSPCIGYAWKIGFDTKSGLFENRGWSSLVGFSTSTPVVFKGRVYLGAGEHGHPGEIICLDDSSGKEIWSYPLDAGVKASPALSLNGDRVRICFTTARVNGSVYCLEDAGDKGLLMWESNPPDDGYILGGVAISDGLIYFGTEGGKLYCLGEAPFRS